MHCVIRTGAHFQDIDFGYWSDISQKTLNRTSSKISQISAAIKNQSNQCFIRSMLILD